MLLLTFKKRRIPNINLKITSSWAIELFRSVTIPNDNNKRANLDNRNTAVLKIVYNFIVEFLFLLFKKTYYKQHSELSTVFFRYKSHTQSTRVYTKSPNAKKKQSRTAYIKPLSKVYQNVKALQGFNFLSIFNKKGLDLFLTLYRKIVMYSLNLDFLVKVFKIHFSFFQ